MSAEEGGGRGRGGERGGNGGERRRLVKRHWLGQCPEQPFPPIAVAVSAEQSVVVQWQKDSVMPCTLS